MNHWVEHRRCPLELVDWFLDREMYPQAACARWCATHADRKVWLPMQSYAERGGHCGPFPGCFGELDWRFDPDPMDMRGTAHGIPVIPGMPCGIITGEYPEDAILALLDAWPPDPVT